MTYSKSHKRRILEDYVERFQFYLKKSCQNRLSLESLKLSFLRGVNEDCMGTPNLIGVVDISQLVYDEIHQICRNCSWSNMKKNKCSRALTSSKTSIGVSRWNSIISYKYERRHHQPSCDLVGNLTYQKEIRSKYFSNKILSTLSTEESQLQM